MMNILVPPNRQMASKGEQIFLLYYFHRENAIFPGEKKCYRIMNA